MTINVMRMFEMRSIIVEAKMSDEVGGGTFLLIATGYSHFDICRLVLDKEVLLRNIDEMARLLFILLQVMAVLRLLAFV